MTHATRMAITAAILLGLSACATNTTTTNTPSGKATAATPYSGASETLFLEVGPELKPCNHGVMQGAQCMQVRELTYNSAGIKTSTGEWGNFYGVIEGFAHETGVRNVLRVKRHARQNVPADASRYVYEMEQRMETERVGVR